MIDFDSKETAAKIKVIGVGGGGGNAINTMVAGRLEGVEFIAANTDVQALAANKAHTKLQLGKSVSRGLGAGANPDRGRDSALEVKDAIAEVLAGRRHGVRHRRHGRRHRHRRRPDHRRHRQAGRRAHRGRGDEALPLRGQPAAQAGRGRASRSFGRRWTRSSSSPTSGCSRWPARACRSPTPSSGPTRCCSTRSRASPT